MERERRESLSLLKVWSGALFPATCPIFAARSMARSASRMSGCSDGTKRHRSVRRARSSASTSGRCDSGIPRPGRNCIVVGVVRSSQRASQASGGLAAAVRTGHQTTRPANRTLKLAGRSFQARSCAACCCDPKQVAAGVACSLTFVALAGRNPSQLHVTSTLHASSCHSMSRIRMQLGPA